MLVKIGTSGARLARNDAIPHGLEQRPFTRHDMFIVCVRSPYRLSPPPFTLIGLRWAVTHHMAQRGAFATLEPLPPLDEHRWTRMEGDTNKVQVIQKAGSAKKRSVAST